MHSNTQKLNTDGQISDLSFEPAVHESNDPRGESSAKEAAIYSFEPDANAEGYAVHRPDGHRGALNEQVQMRDAFVQEAIPHTNLLFNYALKLLGNRLDADDLLQDTFMRAFRFFNTYEKGTNCKAWLFRIMKNLYINRYRKDQKEAAKVDYGLIENFFDSVRSAQFESNDLQERIFSMLLDDNIVNALDSIKDDFKVVIILCDLEGFSYEEIADFLHCPIGTVRSRLHRGRRILQKKLAYLRPGTHQMTSSHLMNNLSRED